MNRSKARKALQERAEYLMRMRCVPARLKGTTDGWAERELAALEAADTQIWLNLLPHSIRQGVLTLGVFKTEWWAESEA